MCGHSDDFMCQLTARWKNKSLNTEIIALRTLLNTDNDEHRKFVVCSQTRAHTHASATTPCRRDHPVNVQSVQGTSAATQTRPSSDNHTKIVPVN
jgi:hypothetical protein